MSEPSAADLLRAQEILAPHTECFRNGADVDRVRQTLAEALSSYGDERAAQFTTVYPASEYQDDYGTVLWWHFPVCEPPCVGLFEDCVEGWHTHFSRMPIVWDGNGQPLKIGR